MILNTMKKLLWTAILTATLAACGAAGDGAAAPTATTGFAATTSIGGLPQPAPSTTADGQSGRLPSIEPVVTLAPDGAYPIVDASDQMEGRPPGRYRVRDDFSADWPEQCLPERIVLPPPDASYDVTKDNVVANAADLAEFEQAGRDALARIQELQTPICKEYWDAWIASWPKAPELPPAKPGTPPTTTIG